MEQKKRVAAAAAAGIESEWRWRRREERNGIEKGYKGVVKEFLFFCPGPAARARLYSV